MALIDIDTKMLRCRIVLNAMDRLADTDGQLVEAAEEGAYSADGLALVVSFDGTSVGAGFQGTQVPISITIDGIIIQAEAIAQGLKVMLRLTFGRQGADKVESVPGITLAPTDGRFGGKIVSHRLV